MEAEKTANGGSREREENGDKCKNVTEVLTEGEEKTA